MGKNLEDRVINISGKAMKASRLDLAGTFCWNRDCQIMAKQIMKHSQVWHTAFEMHYPQEIFVENKNTVFYGRHHSSKRYSRM